MPAPIPWPSTITYTVDSGLAFDSEAIGRAFAAWRSVLPYDFLEVPLDATFALAPLEDVLAAFSLGSDPVAVNVTVVAEDAWAGVHSYVGLDLGRALAAGWEPWVVALHEIGHAFGLADRPAATGTQSLYGYAEPHPQGLTADAVAFVQSGLGASPRDDRIEITGIAGGAVSGGPGHDLLLGAAGAEVVYGNQGDDSLLAGGADDTLYGGQDRDMIRGDDGADVLYGNLGSDTLSGGPGPDRLYGGQEDDVIHAGPGDTVWGGLGADTVWADPLAVIGQHDPADSIIYLLA